MREEEEEEEEERKNSKYESEEDEEEGEEEEKDSSYPDPPLALRSASLAAWLPSVYARPPCDRGVLGRGVMVFTGCSSISSRWRGDLKPPTRSNRRHCGNVNSGGGGGDGDDGSFQRSSGCLETERMGLMIEKKRRRRGRF